MNAIHLNIPEHGALKLHLKQSAYFTLPARRAMALEVLSGCAWVTQTGDPEDHLLGKGDRFDLPGQGEAIVQAMRESDIALAPRAPVKPNGLGDLIKQFVADLWRTESPPRALCRETAEAATQCWRNVIARRSANRLGLERTF